MDITSQVAANATQMKQAENTMKMSTAVAKKGLDVQKMQGENALKLIESATGSDNGANAAARAQGKGSIINVTA